MSEEGRQGLLAARDRAPARRAKKEELRRQYEESLRQPKKSKSGWYNSCPGDVAARDSF